MAPIEQDVTTMKCHSLLLPLILATLAGCYKQEPTATAPAPSIAAAHNCVTTGADSPIVVGENSAVVINGKTYTPGQNADCLPASNNLSTHGVNSPIVTGKGSTVIIHTER